MAGPTAVGKTDLCIKLAKKFKTAIISSDSRQFYIETNIGTAKPSAVDMKDVPHYFVDNLSIREDYDVRKFEKDALQLLEKLYEEHHVVIMTGGSGLYIDAVCDGFDAIPDIDPSIRQSLNTLFEEQGIEALQATLAALDPDYYATVDIYNPQRLIRGCEVTLGTGKPFSSFRKRKKAKRPFEVIKVGLERDREELYARINLRMDQMIAAGLFAEAEALFPYRHLNALQTVGYTEVFGYLEGKYDKEEAVRLLKRNSRRYAKRQMTWFKRDGQIQWFSPGQFDEITKYVEDQMRP
ncbi:tRNA (adenosine(37)-N6)-dimethylallyltransferase MiaA [Echinicola strongylocentroti]|uniref:tRNA (adenosine(37)-N6)-dimethylallyltransferase MiaA n=1 Tax=Echinicola strongylocentroti TaxID=1795355 RepID=UPI001FE37B01|nr:tRNA (adenosine(37)-N6)-dimethylallyltransferase MiaA [Echinicola strongylocentroti]